MVCVTINPFDVMASLPLDDMIYWISFLFLGEASISDEDAFSDLCLSWSSCDGQTNFYSHGDIATTLPSGFGIVTFSNGLFMAMDVEMPSDSKFNEQPHVFAPGYLWPTEINKARCFTLGRYHVDSQSGLSSFKMVPNSAREYMVCDPTTIISIKLTLKRSLRHAYS